MIRRFLPVTAALAVIPRFRINKDYPTLIILDVKCLVIPSVVTAPTSPTACYCCYFEQRPLSIPYL